ncbi:hypothetical protein KQI82_06305 [Oscillibacter sp. MSJ-2]|uniref:DUF2198 family protein n=1 Tax=Dysosmobacter acutus TaxID=2841504 RepID=A0ABS6FA70_9FIRM|nr:hypothetical protein [Dysosmobacter acutus]MBU5626531.1 hypothetical protein [Dysosmobacter acutus]
MYLEEIGAALVALGISCIPLVLVIRAERDRGWSVPGIIAAVVMAVVQLFAQKGGLSSIILGIVMFSSLAYYVAERLTRKG